VHDYVDNMGKSLIPGASKESEDNDNAFVVLKAMNNYI